MDRQTLRLGSPLQRGRDCRAVQSASPGTQAQAKRRADGGIEGGRTGRARSGIGQNRAVTHRRFVPVGGGALGRQLQRDRDAAAVVVTGSVAPQDPARHPQTDEKAQQAFKKGTLQSA